MLKWKRKGISLSIGIQKIFKVQKCRVLRNPEDLEILNFCKNVQCAYREENRIIITRIIIRRNSNSTVHYKVAVRKINKYKVRKHINIKHF